MHLFSGGWNWISSLWSAMKCPVVSFWVSGFGMALSSLSFNAQGCIPAFWRISMYVLLWNLLALGWSLVSVYIWRLLDELLSITIPWNQEFSDVLKFLS